MNTTNIACAPDGAIINFPHSLVPFMKICNCKNGYGGVVNLNTGAHYTIREIITTYGEQVEVIAKDIYEWTDLAKKFLDKVLFERER